MRRADVSRLAAVCTLVSLLIFVVSCSKKQSGPAEAQGGSTATQAHSEAAGTGAAADASLAAPEETGQANASGSGALQLPTSFPRRTGDLDEMVKNRNVRALVEINPVSFFYSQGRPQGITYEALEELERLVNKQFNTGKLKVKVTFIPLRPDELGPALTGGVGDLIAQGIIITPAREEKYAFTTPIIQNVNQIIVTGKDLASANSFDDLAGKDIYVNPLAVSYENLKKISEDRVKVRKPPLSIKAADKNLLDDDLIEMVNAGLFPATAAMEQKARLWEQVLPNLSAHPQMLVTSGGQLAWVIRKNNPELKKLLDEFIATHGAGTSFGNTLLRRYLQNTKWIKNSTSTEEMKKYATLVDYFKTYAGQYNFDYLMIAAQAYQESLLDQSRRSRVGAVGIMQVIPKYAAAPPINVPDVRTADKNILAGVRMLNNIATTYFNDPGIDQVNKTLFTFASYNAGPNRIVRLRKQAADEGLDPNKWFGNVELVVAKEVGQETVTYVSNIYKYYIAYKLAAERSEELQKLKAAGS
jgi:membrane-bound lytic murein transglycosylase MltF